jgi:L-asparaginase
MSSSESPVVKFGLRTISLRESQPMNATPLRIIATGGTFDKCYAPIDGSLGFSESCVPALVGESRLQPAPVIEVLMLVDSLDMTPAQRQSLVAACQAAPESQLVIIHGTDTLVESAAAIAATAPEKTIVLTGAMVPARFDASDARFNLGFAIAAARVLPAGVWVAIHGLIQRWDQVRKNRAAGAFEAL